MGLPGWLRGRRREPRNRDFTLPVVNAWKELAETGVGRASLPACAVTGPLAIDRAFLP